MTARDLARDLLQEFARTRAPLVADAPAAVMRSIALAMVSTLAESAREREVRIMAAATLAAHLGETPPSKRQATKQEFATASALFADVIRALVGAQYEREAVNKLIALFAAFDDEPDARSRTLKWLPRATMMVAMCGQGDAAVQLRAARWILSRTRAPAQKVGYGKRSDTSPSQGEVERSEGEGGCAEQARTFHPHPPCGHPLPERERGMGTELRSRPPP